jgi:hypothetical protein
VGRQVGLDIQPGMPRYAWLWPAATAENFELRLRFRGQAPAAVWFRGEGWSNGDRKGYMASLGGVLFENVAHSGARAFSALGQQTTVTNLAGKTSITSLAALASLPQVRGALRPGDWNEFVLLAHGNHFVWTINGVVVADTTVWGTAFGGVPFYRSGQFALEFTTNAKNPSQIEFKDLRFKPLAASASP